MLESVFSIMSCAVIGYVMGWFGGKIVYERIYAKQKITADVRGYVGDLIEEMEGSPIVGKYIGERVESEGVCDISEHNWERVRYSFPTGQTTVRLLKRNFDEFSRCYMKSGVPVYDLNNEEIGYLTWNCNLPVDCRFEWSMFNLFFRLGDTPKDCVNLPNVGLVQTDEGWIIYNIMGVEMGKIEVVKGV